MPTPVIAARYSQLVCTQPDCVTGVEDIVVAAGFVAALVAIVVDLVTTRMLGKFFSGA
jgi:hypothetical protein